MTNKTVRKSLTSTGKQVKKKSVPHKRPANKSKPKSKPKIKTRTKSKPKTKSSARPKHSLQTRKPRESKEVVVTGQ